MPATLIGVLLQLSALALFVCMDSLVKALTAQFAVPQLMWARFLFSLLAAALFIRLTTGHLPWRSRAPGVQAIRSLLLAGCNLMFSTALAEVPLADCTAIGFASPLFTVALARFWLKEKVSPRRWAGVCIGLVGVFIALRPSFLFGGEPPPAAALLPLGTAVLFAVYQVLTRRLAAVDNPHTTILHTGLAATLVTSLVQPLVWAWPSGTDWLLLVGLGALGGMGHGLLVLAFARAPASLLSPLSYTQLVWAMLAGVVVFGDWPQPLALLGMAIIVGGGILVAIPERRRSG